MAKTAFCAACGTEATATCNHCENPYCGDHISRAAHNCLGEFEESSDEEDDRNLEAGHVPYHQGEGGGLTPPEKATSGVTQTTDTDSQSSQSGETIIKESSASSGRFLAGALILIVGAILTVTVFGALLGVPMMILGFGIMFPRFTIVAVGLAVLAFFLLLFSL